MMMTKVRIFGSSDCQNCTDAIILLKKSKIDFDYIDAESQNKDIQKMCDYYDVDKLPHLHFFNEKEEIIFEHKGEISEDELLEYIIDFKKDK